MTYMILAVNPLGLFLTFIVDPSSLFLNSLHAELIHGHRETLTS